MNKLFSREHLLKMTPARLVLDLFLLAIIVAIVLVVASVIYMPGTSFKGTPPPLTTAEQAVEADLKQEVQTLGGRIGERNSAKYAKLNEAIAYIEDFLRAQHYAVHEQAYNIEDYVYKNIWVEIPGTTRPYEIVIVGGHYDSVAGAPGANDNGSGTAATLELAKLFAGTRPQRTLRFVLFTNEEPPYFSSQEMGSYHYAAACHGAHENIVALLDPETLGYYTDAANSQKYPSFFTPFYPTQGNFIGFVANSKSRHLVEACVKTFRATTPFPSEGVAAPEFVNGVDWADQYWFWKFGYPGVMITDTALYRYPYYHTAQDTPDKLSYPAFARVVCGLQRVVQHLANKH